MLNDPNGLIYHNGKYYISHQWFPLGAVHGLKYWFNYTSDDLVTFEPQDSLIKPDTYYDSHGVYSGSAFEHNGDLYYMYTGNHRDEQWNRYASQMIAKVQNNGAITKFDAPVIPSQPEGYTSHFRDPKVFELNNEYYAIIGAQTNEELGCCLIYKTNDKQLNQWSYCGEIDTKLKTLVICGNVPIILN